MEDREYVRGPDGTKYYYDELAARIAKEFPDLNDEHISLQLGALGLWDVFLAGTTPFMLPYTFMDC